MNVKHVVLNCFVLWKVAHQIVYILFSIKIRTRELFSHNTKTKT